MTMAEMGVSTQHFSPSLPLLLKYPATPTFFSSPPLNSSMLQDPTNSDSLLPTIFPITTCEPAQNLSSDIIPTTSAPLPQHQYPTISFACDSDAPSEDKLLKLWLGKQKRRNDQGSNLVIDDEATKRLIRNLI